MKNITISVPEDVYREARIHAARHDTSVSALVSEYLRRLGQTDDSRPLVELQKKVQETITSFRASDRLPRDEAHDRAVR